MVDSGSVSLSSFFLLALGDVMFLALFNKS